MSHNFLSIVIMELLISKFKIFCALNGILINDGFKIRFIFIFIEKYTFYIVE